MVKFQGGGVVVKFDVFSHCYTVRCAVCIQAMIHSVDNVQVSKQLNWCL